MWSLLVNGYEPSAQLKTEGSSKEEGINFYWKIISSLCYNARSVNSYIKFWWWMMLKLESVVAGSLIYRPSGCFLRKSAARSRGLGAIGFTSGRAGERRSAVWAVCDWAPINLWVLQSGELQGWEYPVHIIRHQCWERNPSMNPEGKDNKCSNFGVFSGLCLINQTSSIGYF